jgi:hypothetical protein
MLTNEQLDKANAFGESLRLAVHERSLPATSRVRAAGSCLSIAQDHHHAIVVLLGARLFAPCFALLRVEFEAYVRGEWLALCAADLEVSAFLNGDEPPRIGVMLAALEDTEAFRERRLTQIKKAHWRTLCGYTHTGGIHVQRWNTEDGIEANYSEDGLVEMLRFADIVASLAVLGVLALGDDAEASEKVLKQLKERVGQHEF